MEKIIAIIGPTAVGKTKISIELAKLFSTEIVSGDALLVYRGFDIGTAKPDMAERDGIEHHLIDILPPDAAFNVVDFLTLAQQSISAITARGRIPILAGGTGLYVKALLEGYEFNRVSGDDDRRQELLSIAQEHGAHYLHSLLAAKDPATAARLHPHDVTRIVRALEVKEHSGETVSQHKAAVGSSLMYDAAVVGLTMDRQRLYDRINCRVDIMLEQGLVDEVTRLLAAGVAADAPAMKGIGYKEIVAALQGSTTIDKAIDNIKKSTRHFAKRQLTWYRKMPYIKWFAVDAQPMEKTITDIYRYVAGRFSKKANV